MTRVLPAAPRGRERWRRDAWQRAIATLDPETDYEIISAVDTRFEFPWDIQQALSFALFRTFAVPSIGVLLHETQEFTERTQKRHDDTVLVLDAIVEDGMESSPGRAAVRRMNQMHGAYAISNDDLRYVLATFVVTPVRWLADYGWRPLGPAEVDAATRSYQRMGELMGIKDIPASYAEFETLLDAYERTHFAYDDRSREVADATLALLCSYYPRLLRPAVEVFSRSVMDPHVRDAFGYATPPRAVVALSRGLLRLRGRALRLAPPRVAPSRPEDRGAIRTYLPGGYRIEDLGTHV